MQALIFLAQWFSEQENPRKKYTQYIDLDLDLLIINEWDSGNFATCIYPIDLDLDLVVDDSETLFMF